MRPHFADSQSLGICWGYKYAAPPELQIDPVATAPGSDTTSLLHRCNPINHHPRHGGNNLAIVCMIGGERHQNEFHAVWHFHVRRIVTRGAGPAGFRPELDASHSLQRDAGKTMALIVVVFRS